MAWGIETDSFDSSFVQICDQVPQHIPMLGLQQQRSLAYTELPHSVAHLTLSYDGPLL